jgi:hypothetical protein
VEARHIPQSTAAAAARIARKTENPTSRVKQRERESCKENYFLMNGAEIRFVASF